MIFYVSYRKLSRTSRNVVAGFCDNFPPLLVQNIVGFSGFPLGVGNIGDCSCEFEGTVLYAVKRDLIFFLVVSLF